MPACDKTSPSLIYPYPMAGKNFKPETREAMNDPKENKSLV